MTATFCIIFPPRAPEVLLSPQAHRRAPSSFLIFASSVVVLGCLFVLVCVRPTLSISTLPSVVWVSSPVIHQFTAFTHFPRAVAIFPDLVVWRSPRVLVYSRDQFIFNLRDCRVSQLLPSDLAHGGLRWRRTVGFDLRICITSVCCRFEEACLLNFTKIFSYTIHC